MPGREVVARIEISFTEDGVAHVKTWRHGRLDASYAGVPASNLQKRVLPEALREAMEVMVSPQRLDPS